MQVVTRFCFSSLCSLLPSRFNLLLDLYPDPAFVWSSASDISWRARKLPRQSPQLCRKRRNHFLQPLVVMSGKEPPASVKASRTDDDGGATPITTFCLSTYAAALCLASHCIASERRRCSSGVSGISTATISSREATRYMFWALECQSTSSSSTASSGYRRILLTFCCCAKAAAGSAICPARM